MSTEGYVPFSRFDDWTSLRIDTTAFDGYAAILDGLRASSDPAALVRAIRTATRLAAIDTGAIEGLYEVDRGFTRTVAIEGVTWEAAIDARGPLVRRSFEDALAAYDFVLDIATGRAEISTKAIREIHAIICASQVTYRVLTAAGIQEQPLPLGEYKTQPNSPTNLTTGRLHYYAPPLDTPAEMDRLVRELRSAEFEAAHPVLQAAYAHHAFVAIHPFADGNGRVSRALASAYLYRRPGVPLVVFADQKDEYIDALEAADAGVPADFVRFVADRVEDVIGIVQATAAQMGLPPAGASLASLGRLLAESTGLSAEEMEVIGERILDAVRTELHRQIRELPPPPGMSMKVQGSSPGIARYGPDAPYELIGAGWQEIALSAPRARITAGLGVAARMSGEPAFVLIASGLPHLGIELRDVFPTLSTVFSIKLRAWVDALVTRLLGEFSKEVEKVYGAPPT
jgi:Fic family protein